MNIELIKLHIEKKLNELKEDYIFYDYIAHNNVALKIGDHIEDLTQIYNMLDAIKD